MEGILEGPKGILEGRTIGRCNPNHRHQTGDIGTTNPLMRSQIQAIPTIKQPLGVTITPFLHLYPIVLHADQGEYNLLRMTTLIGEA